jgi:hypothetical protein
MEIMDEYVMMRLAQLIYEGKAGETIERALQTRALRAPAVNRRATIDAPWKGASLRLPSRIPSGVLQ